MTGDYIVIISFIVGFSIMLCTICICGAVSTIARTRSQTERDINALAAGLEQRMTKDGDLIWSKPENKNRD